LENGGEHGLAFKANNVCFARQWFVEKDEEAF
jgi:hypothetical protein